MVKAMMRSLLPYICAGIVALALSMFLTVRVFVPAHSQTEPNTEDPNMNPPTTDLPAPEPLENEVEEDEDMDEGGEEQVDSDQMELPRPAPSELPRGILPQFADESDESLLPPFDPGGYFPEPGNKRNPFLPSAEVRNMRITDEKVEVPLEPLQRFELSQLRVLGIMWDIAEPRAMIADPSGKVHIVRQRQKVGRNNGVIALIREGELVVVESEDPGTGELDYATTVLAIGR